MNGDRIHIRASSAPWHTGVEIGIWKEDHYVEKLIWSDTPQRHTPIEPAINLGTDQAQTLMDDLWQSGLRPTQAIKGDATLAAVEHHLADMQLIAFDRLKIVRGAK